MQLDEYLDNYDTEEVIECSNCGHEFEDMSDNTCPECGCINDFYE